MADVGTATLETVARGREADTPRNSLVARIGRPLKLDAGVDLAPFQIAYKTYGTLNADRSNAVLLCHALTGDHHVASAQSGDRKIRLVGDDGRPRQADRHRALLHHLPQRDRRLHGLDRSGFDQSADRQAVGPRFPGHHHPRHGACPGDAARRAWHQLAVRGGGRLDGRHAGAAMGRELSQARVQRAADRLRDAPFGAEHCLPRGGPAGGDGRSGLAARPLFRRGHQSAARARGRAHGRAHHVSLGRRAASQVRPQVSGSREPDVLVRRRLRSGDPICVIREARSSSASTRTPIST